MRFAWLQFGIIVMTPVDTMSPEVAAALKVLGACAVCWFCGYGAGSVQRTIRRLFGKSAS
jgi:hypothetical protein